MTRAPEARGIERTLMQPRLKALKTPEAAKQVYHGQSTAYMNSQSRPRHVLQARSKAQIGARIDPWPT